jgi:uncharacterized protein YeaO (DUF488 family)
MGGDERMRTRDDVSCGGDPPCWAHLVAEREAPRIRLRRVYDPPVPEDGQRVLVDRLWPRGVKKEAARLDAWRREVAPSADLCRWFGHDATRWPEFRRRYRDELAANPAALDPLLAAARRGPLTLVYATRDERYNQAVVLREVLEERLGCTDSRTAPPDPTANEVR